MLMRPVWPKERNVIGLSIVLTCIIVFAIISISLHIVDSVYTLLKTRASLTVAESLTNFVFLALSFLLLITYRRWRRARRRNEELEDVISSISPDTLLVVDADRTIVMCNRSIERMFGYSVEEVVGRKTELLYRDRRGNPARRHEIYDVLEKEGFHIGEAVGKRKNGETLPLEIISGRLGDREGAVLLLRDVSERRKVEESLRESEKHYRLLAENVSDVIWTTDMSLRFTYVSPSTQRLFGYTVEERMKKPTEEILTPESFKKVQGALKDALEEEEKESGKADPSRFRTMELECVHKDGHRFWIEVKVSFLRDADGRPVGLVGVSRDITERKKAEKALRESEGRFREMAELLPSAMFEMDVEMRLTYTNKAGLKVFGYLPGDVETGIRLLDLVHPEDRQEAIEHFTGILGGEPFGSMECRMLRKDGSGLVAVLNSSPIRRDVRVTGVRTVVHDISDRKTAEEALRMVQGQQLVLEELKRINQMKSEFVETVTHELRTPMTPLMSAAGLLLEGEFGELTAAQRNVLQMMARNIERLSRFARGVLALSRLDADQYPINPDEHSLLAIVQPVTELLKERAAEKGCSLVVDVPAELRVFADPDAVSQIVTNLVNNAVVHCPEGTTIVVSGRKAGNETVEVCVSDDGPGIPAEDMERIFDRFVQLKRKHGPGYRGTGIGLCICQALVGKMGGEITVGSEPGRGAKFTFTLPARRPPERPAESA